MGEEGRRYGILEELAKCSGYDLALMTTFNFEISFFERAVLNRLYAKDIKTISLYVDSKELTNALNEFDFLHSGSNLGRKYMVNPVRMDGAFHPKVILLLGEKKAKLFVGSANIKTSGYATNNEVFSFIEYDANHPRYLDVIVSAIDFFAAVNDMSYKLDNGVITAAKKYVYYHKAERNAETFLLHNIKRTMLEQVGEIIWDKVKNISIAVPYYDKELLALRQVKDMFPDAAVHLFIQNKNSTFPVALNEKNETADRVSVFSRFLDGASAMSGNFYHGKVFLFKTDDKAYVLYGSANCTLSALTKTHSDGGNIECDFLEIGEREDFDYFFDNLDLEVKEKLTSREMVFDPLPASSYYFKYGEIKDRIELHVGFIGEPRDLSVKLGDRELEYKTAQEEIIVFIGEECRDGLTDIFEISLIDEKGIQTVRCWTFHPGVLANNREIRTRGDDFDDFEMDSSGNKYIVDRRRILMAEATCFNELQEYKNNQKYMNQIRMEQEEESNGPEDFVIDYQIPDEYRLAYRKYSEVSRIRNMFVKQFLSFPFVAEINDGKETRKAAVRNEDAPIVVKSRKATSEEKEFERFVKGRVKGMMGEPYVKGIELEHYVGLVQVIIGIFDKYRNQENVEDIFSQDYVSETKILFMRKINEKSTENLPNKDEMQHAVIRKSFAAILENYLYYKNLSEAEERWKYESLNKKLLQELDGKYNLRKDYAPYVREVIRIGKGGVLTLGYAKACEYIEQLYGYKTLEMLKHTIDEVYPNAKISIKGSSMTIDFETDHIVDYGKPNATVLKEVAKYGRNVMKIGSVYINVWNVKAKDDKKNMLLVRRHEVDIYSHKWSHCEVFADGKRMDSKPQYLPY